MAIKIYTSGPVFRPAENWAIVEEYLAKVKDHVARAGESMLGYYGHEFFRYEHKPRTGMWEDNIKTDIVSTDRVIHDDVVYNAWLEGVSERNQTSRFKGYRLWRLVTQDLNRQKYIIAEQVLKIGGFLQRLNGDG